MTNSKAVAVEMTRSSSRCLHWSYFLLITVILLLSVAVSLVLLPFLLNDIRPPTGTDPLACSPTPYTGSTCLQELSDWESCLPERENSSTGILIPDSIDQDLAEYQATMLFTGLQLVRPSQECEREFREFWCLLLFGLCDDSQQTRLPSFELCDSLQTQTCFDLIQFAATVPEFSVIIQNCNNFRIGQPPTCRNETVEKKKQEFNVSCSESFFYDERSLLCVPRCGEWSPLSSDVHTVLYVLLLIGNIASVIICTSILVLSIIQHKQIFTFPSVLIVYSTVTVLVVSLLDFVSFLPFNSLLCSSGDLLENYRGGDHTTTLCKFQGALFLYAVLVISLLWLFQTAAYFWVVIYPVNFRSFRTSGRLRIIHLVAVIISFTLPAVLVVAICLGKGFVYSLFAPNKCALLDVDAFFYSFSIPFVIVIICGLSLLVTTLWHIGNVSARLQKKPTPRDGKLKAAELKLILLIITYMCVGIHSNLSANITLSHSGRHARVLEDYFVCESLGDPAVHCSRDDLAELERDSFAQISVYLAFALYPAIFFIFLLSPRTCSRVCCREGASTAPVSSSTVSTSQA